MLPTHSALNTQTIAFCIEVKPSHNVNESIKLHKIWYFKWPFSNAISAKRNELRDSNQLTKEKHVDNTTGKIVLAF